MITWRLYPCSLKELCGEIWNSHLCPSSTHLLTRPCALTEKCYLHNWGKTALGHLWSEHGHFMFSIKDLRKVIRRSFRWKRKSRKAILKLVEIVCTSKLIIDSWIEHNSNLKSLSLLPLVFLLGYMWSFIRIQSPWSWLLTPWFPRGRTRSSMFG